MSDGFSFKTLGDSIAALRESKQARRKTSSMKPRKTKPKKTQPIKIQPIPYKPKEHPYKQPKQLPLQSLINGLSEEQYTSLLQDLKKKGISF